MPYLSVVLETKLKPPSQRGLLIARPRLENLLSNQRSILLITAAAGYGKTSFLTQLYAQSQDKNLACAWYTLDKTDNDIVRFAHTLIEAIKRSIPQFGVEILALIKRGANPSSETLMTLFINEISQLKKDIKIHLDDFHLIKSPELLETLNEMFLRSPSNLNWIVAMRHTPLGLSLGRLRALGKLQEINADDLRFTLSESEKFFTNSMQLTLSNPDLTLLIDRTEGWVAGLQLASLSLHKVKDPQHWINNLSGEYRDIANFLTDEVLRTLDERVREFLLQTSILTRFNQELCTAVTKMTDCSNLLEQVVTAHLFIFSLDETDDWYRYHHLFSEFLERRLREADQKRYKELHSCASVWYEEHKFYLDAIHHACCADDLNRAAVLLDHISETLFSTGHIKTLEEQVVRIPEEILQQQPRLMLDLAWQNILSWDFKKGKAMLDLVSDELARQRGLHANTKDKKKLKLKSNLTTTQLYYLEGKLKHRQMMLAAISDNLVQTEIDCEAWIAENYPSDPSMHMLTSVQILLQSARRDRFVVGETLALADSMHDICVKHNVLYGSIYHDALVGITLCMQSQYSEAELRYKNALKDATDLHGRLSIISSTPALLLSELYYVQNKIDVSRELINEYLPKSLSLGLADQLIAGYLTKSRLHVLDDNFDMAFECLSEGFKQVVRFGFSRLEAHLINERIRLYCLLGEIQQAVVCGRQFHLMGPSTHLRPDQDATTSTYVLAMAWARLASVRGESALATRLLKSWWKFLSDRGCWEPALKVGICMTSIALENGDISTARGVFHICLRLKGAETSIRFFLDEGMHIKNLLMELDSEQVTESVELISRLLVAFSNDPMKDYPLSRSIEFSLNDVLLKDREVEVLELAADDRSNSEIASRLSISLNTVKWYWQQIFTKLDVRRRGSAVTKARELGIIR